MTSRHRARETVELLKIETPDFIPSRARCKYGRLESVVGNAGEGLQEPDQEH